MSVQMLSRFAVSYKVTFCAIPLFERVVSMLPNSEPFEDRKTEENGAAKERLPPYSNQPPAPTYQVFPFGKCERANNMYKLSNCYHYFIFLLNSFSIIVNIQYFIFQCFGGFLLKNGFGHLDCM